MASRYCSKTGRKIGSGGKRPGAGRKPNPGSQWSRRHAAYRVLRAAQAGLCAICRRAEGKKALSVDHCHVTGKIRGLLCQHCNVMIGYARENIATLEAAIDYLRRFQN